MDIDSLKLRRRIIKSACTRIKNWVDPIGERTPEILAQVLERKEKLDKHWEEYDSIQSQIEVLLPNEESDRDLFENAYFYISGKLRNILNPPSMGISGSTEHLNTESNLNHSSDIGGNRDQSMLMRLPKLNLPTFSGKYEDWLPFFNVFSSVINGNNSLSNVQKFQYLHASLKGDAAAVIHSLELSDENYLEAWDLLKKRYDNSRIIVQTHIREILDLPNMSRENFSDLRLMADHTSKHIRALTSLKRPVDKWDDVLVYILSSKLDPVTSREWQSRLKANELPTLTQFLDFITHRYQSLEVSSKTIAPASRSNIYHQANMNRRSLSHVVTFQIHCTFCKGEHPMYQCSEFLKLPIPSRIKEIKGRKLCINCLRTTDHSAISCPSGVCKSCGGKHNSLLHLSTSRNLEVATREASPESASSDLSRNATIANHASVTGSYVMLSTAVVYAYNREGSQRTCRILFDCGSQANFVSRSFIRSLELPTKPLNILVSGISQLSTTANEGVKIKLQSRINSFSAEIDCIVTDQISDRFPAIPIRPNDLKIPHNIKLADPKYYKSSEIDVLVGADLFWRLICVGQIKASLYHPLLQKTQFGWVLAGRLANGLEQVGTVKNYHLSVTNAELDDQLKRFWEIDDAPINKRLLSLDEQFCENHFTNNTTRDEKGRFVVRLPCREDRLNSIGQSKSNAVRRFYNLERRFQRDPEFKAQYSRFMSEYLSLHHMRIVDDVHSDDSPIFYLPHHGVIQQSGMTMKLRVVFDASARSTSGVSLNDALIVGPVVQQDLISILLRFRTLAYVFTADVVKMYRQISVHESQTSLQRIVWRENPTDPLKTYELTTLTYGTSPASHLATRCIQHLAEQEASDFPLGSQRLIRDSYMDDILTGADSIDEAEVIRTEVIELLSKGCFELAKWISNYREFPGSEDTSGTGGIVDFNKNHDSRVLGIRWNCVDDSFNFNFDVNITDIRVNKRSILSIVAKIFDPTGLIGPVIIIPKLIIQELWQLGIDWDASVPYHVHTRWCQLKDQLAALNDIKIPRLVRHTTEMSGLQVHGFCDASQQAYGACVYIRSQLPDGSFSTALLCSKSRVAPLKVVSLPRLELCAAALLAQLIEKVEQSLGFRCARRILWSDSTITLNWISSCSKKWSVFIANRVGEIQRITDISDWRHVVSQHNPADLLSRGTNPAELIRSELWWYGPSWLRLHENSWPNSNFRSLEIIPEERKVTSLVVIDSQNSISNLIENSSSLNRICRVLAFVLRFIASIRTKTTSVNRELLHSEIKNALHVLCKFVQATEFSREVKLLSNGKVLDSNSKLLSLSPFIDKEGLLRVGGRLKNSNLSHSSKHQILLPGQHRLTKLIIEHEHKINMHSGVQLTIASLRQQFWPISAKSVTRKIVRNCVTCFKCKPATSEAIMGQLPSARVTISRPFSHTGVDYAGPFVIKEGKRRNSRN